MVGKKDNQEESFRREMQLEHLVERLCLQITDCLHKNKDPETACVVYLAGTDQQAVEYGWPNVEMMREGVKQALEILPKHVVDRVEVEEV